MYFKQNSIICLVQYWEYWILEIIDEIVNKLLFIASKTLTLETLSCVASKWADKAHYNFGHTIT